MSTEQKDKTLFVTTIILVVVHLAGILGILSPYKNLFLLLTPLNLLVSTSLLLLNHKEFVRNFYIFCFVTFLAGFFVEVLGTRTGLIFGKYMYGNTLGFKIANVPLIIGINWLILIYSVGCVFDKLKNPILIKSILGAATLVLLDVYIEPVAIKYDFWFWDTTTIPIQNYIAWFLVSFVLLLFFYKSNFNKENKFAKAFFLIQLMFFTLLSIF